MAHSEGFQQLVSASAAKVRGRLNQPNAKFANSPLKALSIFFFIYVFTLESGIDVGQGINIGPGKIAKKNKRRALNKRRASEF